jgi:rod shape-determining protein MreB
MSFKSKTSALAGIRALQNLVSDSMAIDIGSASTIISVRGRGIVIDEPSLVAVNAIDGEVIAVGVEAQQMYGREARGVEVIAPMRSGVVADFERTKAMLAHFVGKARGGISNFSSRGLMSIFSDVTPVEERALLSAAEHARIRRVGLIEEGLAAALGAGVRPDDARGSAVVDIGGSTTNVAIIASGKIVHVRGERIGSWDINAAIINHVRRHRGLLIGAHTAERLKLELASAIVPVDISQEMTLKGRDALTGIPSSVLITAGEIYPVAEEVVRKIVQSVSTTLTEVPPEIAGDIYDRGITLTGGGALFVGLDDYLSATTKLSVRVADEPKYAIVHGLEQMFDEPFSMQREIRHEQQAELDLDSGSF